MATTDLEQVARALVTRGKGILAADETVATLTKRLAVHEIESTADSRRAYRELFFTTPGVAKFIGGAILQDETIRQKDSTGILFATLLAERDIIPGIKVDEGAKPMAGAPRELITEGLDGLRRRLADYRELGARFAKWRAVFSIADELPSGMCVRANAEALARYAALCQEQGIVPIVEPEVLMRGSHGLARCEEVTGAVLHAVFDALSDHRISLEGIVLKPNMVTAGHDFAQKVPVNAVAAATVRVLARHVPPAVPTIAFLSGGQHHVLATQHLSAINELEATKPWALSFSFGRALQDEALVTWRGRSENVAAAQRAFLHRAKCESAAALGRYRSEMESEAA